MTLFAEVILPLPLDRYFLYIVPDSQKAFVGVGSRVLVPFKEQDRTGIVIKLKQRGIPKDLKLKEIHAVLDNSPLLSEKFLAFTKKLSAYYYSSWGELLQASLPPTFALKTQVVFSITDRGQMALDEGEVSDREKAILLFLKERSYSDIYLKRKLKMGNLSFILSQLRNKEFIRVRKEVKTASLRRKRPSPSGPTQLEMDFSLSDSLYGSASQIIKDRAGKTSSFYFLYGPSERREAVYFYLIKRTLALKKRVLYLVPEIATTHALIEKFRKRFGENATLLHSRMSARSREEEWSRIRAGQVDVVVGPRLAVLSPVEDLGLVIVDEEQDESFFQRENPSYDARRGAYLRAKQDRAILVFGSSAPAVESYFSFMKTNRVLDVFEGASNIHAELIMHRPEAGPLSPELIDSLNKAIQSRNPVLVFYFRRGFASSIACSRCGYTPKCQDCDITLTYHRREDRLVCHYCGHSYNKITDCPVCSHKIILKRGLGIEAVEEQIRRQFPKSRVVGFDSDVAKRSKDQEKLLDLFQKRKVDILVGTQLLVRQKDLSKVALVVVLYPETILALPDFRASQRTFQTIIQAAQHLSADEDSKLLIQTAFPDHFSIRSAAHLDYEEFYTQEIKFRRLMNYPPFTYMVEVLFQGANLRSIAKETRDFSTILKNYSKDVEILGPALAAVPRLRGRSRVQIFLKSKRKRDLDKALKQTIGKVKVNKKVIVYS